MNCLRPFRVGAAVTWLLLGSSIAGVGSLFGGQVNVGNLVFRDRNGNGRADTGEGVPNVEVKLFASGADPLNDLPVASTFTDGQGRYLFLLVNDGSYFMHVPPAEFQIGGDLAGMWSLWGTTNGLGPDDDQGEDGVDDLDPAANGIRTDLFTVLTSQSPTAATGETGFDAASDDADDPNADLTIDFGFYFPVGVGNVIYVDTDADGLADPGEGVPGVIVQLFRSGDNPATDPPFSEVTSDTLGGFLFYDFPEGDYFIHIPAFEFTSGRPLLGATSLPGQTPGADDDVGEDTTDAGDPIIDGARTAVFNLTAGDEPTDAAGETGTSAADDNAVDENVDLTRDLGFALPADWVGVGNLVFRDANGNGYADVNEGVDEVVVELFEQGSNPQSDPPLATQITVNGGLYFFGALQPGNYFVHLPASQFGVNAPLEGMVSLPGTDNFFYDDNGGEDGVDAADPAVTGVSSPVFALAVGTEPTAGTSESGESSYTDDFFDSAADLTIDFGFREAAATTMGVGNLVFLDANRNGHADAGEGISGITVRLHEADDNPQIDPPLAEMVTTANGSYGFFNLAAGSYFVHVPKSQFVTGGPLHGKDSVPGSGDDDGLDDNADENGVDNADLDLHGLSSSIFTLGNNQEITDATTETGFNAASDNTDDNNGDLTIDLGFKDASAPLMTVGNLVFYDANNNGHADTGEGVDGVEIRLFQHTADPYNDPPLATTVTANGGQYQFSGLLEGRYIAFIPAAEFQPGGELADRLSLPGAGVDVGFDDNTEEDGLDTPLPEFFGVQTRSFHLQNNLEPIDSGNERGLFATSDNADDNSADLTIDFGFMLDCPTIFISPGILPDGLIGAPYSITFNATGGQAPYTWSSDGTLPPGLALNAAGELTGAPSLAGTWNFSVRAIDSIGCTRVQGCSITILQPMAVGNLVWVDANWNGYFDAGEGTDGVLVELYAQSATPGTDTPQASATTTGGGFYSIPNVPPGSWFLHVPASMFAPGAPLFDKLSLPGTGPATDDDYGEDGEDAVAPAASGVSTALFTLANNNAPTDSTFETGQEAASDNANDANSDLTLDFAFRNPPQPSTFADWQLANELGGSNAPDDNPDGDGQSNLAEYAQMLPAGSGINGATAFRIEHELATFQFHAVFSRPLGGLQDVVITLEGSTDPTLAEGSWQPLGIVPEVVNSGDGAEKVRYLNLAADPVFLGGTLGFVRLRIDLDANHDTLVESTAHTPAWSWAGIACQVQPQTLSLPVLRQDLFTGPAGTITGSSVDVSGTVGSGSILSALEPGMEYYVEVTDGENEGHRFEVNEAACTAVGIELDPAHARSTQTSVPVTLTGATIVLRKHWRVKDALLPAAFRATSSAASADRVLLFNPSTNGYQTLWLFSNSGNPKWVLLGDGSLADSGTRIINAGDGLFVQPRANATSVPVYGKVRLNDAICPLALGSNFIGGFWCAAQSPAERLMTVAAGFTGSTSPTNSDRIRVWSGDSSAAQTYTSYYKLKTASLERWVREGDAQLADRSEELLFASHRAVFVQVKVAKPLWKLTPPAPPPQN